MDPNTIFDQGPAEEHPPVEAAREWPGVPKRTEAAEVRFPAEDGGKSLAEMAVRDLDATLQLLAERAHYITQATGAAIALRDGGEMVCKASAGTSAPEVGARLQMESGLSGESIRTKQVLRCDDAQTDGRVNRESCEALGIASVLVMPMIDDEEVLGVFELFSDHPHAFEERDVAALERMAFMVRAAIARAETGAGENASAAAEDHAEVTAVASSAETASEAGAAKKFEGVATSDSSSPPAEEEEPVQAEQDSAIKDEISLEMPLKKVAEISVFGEPSESAAPTVHTPKIAFHIRSPLPRKTAAALETKSPEGTKEAEPTLPEGPNTTELESARPPETSGTESLQPAGLAGTENEAPKAPNLMAEAASAGVSGAAAAPALAAQEKKVVAEDVSAGSRTGIAEVAPVAPPDEAAVPPVALTFGTAIVPDAAKMQAEEVKTSSAAPPSHDTKPAVEAVPAPKAPVAEASKITSGPTARSVERARSAVAGLRRCESCGFPVSEGRKLCLDCAKKQGSETQTPIKVEAKGESAMAPALDSAAKVTPVAAAAEKPAAHSGESVKPEGDGPQFLVASPDHYESWIVQHMYAAVAAAVVIVGIIVYLVSR
jgi:GAF domain-containing protein